jgi:hypothetical protein
MDAALIWVATGGGLAMDVVFVASEAVPFAKTGGLADVAGALPRALEHQGHRVAVFLPGYRRAKAAGLELVDTGLTVRVPVGARLVMGSILISPATSTATACMATGLSIMTTIRRGSSSSTGPCWRRSRFCGSVPR